MSKASWVMVEPEQGSGNQSVNVSSIEHLGRVVRESSITFTANGCPDVIRIVKQAGKEEFVNINEQISLSNEGGIATIKGISNSKKLTFSLGSGMLPLTLPETYNVNGEGNPVNNGEEIPGDPGATYAFNLSLSINVPANSTFEKLSRQVIVTTENGTNVVCTITMDADTPYLTVEDKIIEIPYIGTAISINVQSNTNWIIK